MRPTYRMFLSPLVCFTHLRLESHILWDERSISRSSNLYFSIWTGPIIRQSNGWEQHKLSTCSKMLNIASNNCKIFKVQVLNQPGLPFGSDYYKIAHTWNKSLVFCKRWGPNNLNLCYSTRLQAWIQVKYMEYDVIYVKIIIIVKICYRSKNIRSLYKLNLLLNK